MRLLTLVRLAGSVSCVALGRTRGAQSASGIEARARYAVSKVASDENRGSTLNHANVVRDFQRMELGRLTTGNWLPRLPTAQPLQVIAYLQDDRSLGVVGAASVSVPCAAVP